MKCCNNNSKFWKNLSNVIIILIHSLERADYEIFNYNPKN